MKIETSSVKKKWKASHVYQRHTRKIDISSLISANPDPEFVSTRGKAAGVTPSNSIDAADDGNKNGDGKGRGRGRRRGSTGPGTVAAFFLLLQHVDIHCLPKQKS